MEVAAFAERLLFGTRLDDKLARPGPLTDPTRAALGGPPPTPGRPDALRFAAKAFRSFPARRALETDEARSTVLHAFANHELLAIELMALALLRFPTAPAAFRTDLVRTIAEEQRHLRSYLDRMATLGTAFGDRPVNGWFWRSMAGIDSPVDYVVRMSLTFEQANLDFACWWRDAFAEVGDGESAALLDTVFRDEIRHVAVGVRWLDRWKADDASLWDAWSTALPSPLTPTRAKGLGFTREGRLAAGLPVSFIDRLELHNHSRGRPARAWWANLDAELELAGGDAPAAVQELVDDLSLLPMFMAGDGDVVITRRAPSPAWLRRMQHAGVPAPHIVHPDDLAAGGPYSELAPWAWTPRAVALHAALPRPVGHAPSRRTPAVGFAKDDDLAILESLVGSEPGAFGPPDIVGVLVEGREAVDQQLATLEARGWKTAVLKVPLGTAGRGQRRVCCGPLTGKDAAWAARHGRLVVEPWLDAVADLSVLLDLTPGRRDPLLAITRFLTRQGTYAGHVVGRRLDGLPPEVMRGLYAGTPSLMDRLVHAARQIAAALPGTGRVGVDALLYRLPGGALRIKPVVEINPRTTMGHVALALERRIAGARTGLWLSWSLRQVRTAGFADLGTAGAALEAAAPLTTEGDPPRWTGGILCTHDPSTARQRLTALVVARSWDDAVHLLPVALRP